MSFRKFRWRRIAGLFVLLTPIALASCSAAPTTATSAPADASGAPRLTKLQVQSLVMDMADDWIAALGQAIYLRSSEHPFDPHSRWLSRSFLRNGTGAAIDIATSPNPDVNLLNMLALSTLQTWAYERHWTKAGINPDTLGRDLQILKRTRDQIWESAAIVLTPRQVDLLHELAARWIEMHPDQMVVALVRFDQFTDESVLPASLKEQRQAAGLLREVQEASIAVDEARLFGERAVWFASRYPYVLGQQAELTTYRIADQPEFEEALKALKAIETIGDLDQTIANSTLLLSDLLTTQQDAAFKQFAVEREATIKQAGQEIAQAMEHSTQQAFDTFEKARGAIMNDIMQQQGQLAKTLPDLRSTIEISSILAADVKRTVEATDNLVSRFDREADPEREPLDFRVVHDTVTGTAEAARELTTLVDRANETMLSPAWTQRIDQIESLSADLIDHAFYRGLILVLVLVSGLGLIRLIPQRRQPA